MHTHTLAHTMSLARNSTHTLVYNVIDIYIWDGKLFIVYPSISVPWYLIISNQRPTENLDPETQERAERTR